MTSPAPIPRCPTVPCPDHPRPSDALVAALTRAVVTASAHIPGSAW